MSDVIAFPTTRTGSPTIECAHEVFECRGLRLSVCPVDGSSEWYDGDDPIDGSVAMARLFGDFDLVATVDGIGRPGATTLVYDPGRTGSRRLRAFPEHRWLEGTPGLSFAHDGAHLLLAPTDPRLVEHLTR